jgi:hypothetical protein
MGPIGNPHDKDKPWGIGDGLKSLRYTGKKVAG